MPLDNKSAHDPANAPASAPAPPKSNFSTQFAMAMELPFVLVGTVILGGLLGYFLDRWLHTRPFLMLIFGALGFFAGVREILRRLPGSTNGRPAR